MTDEVIGSFWQRVALTVTHAPIVMPIMTLSRLQKHLRNPYAYWPEILMCLVVDFASIFHHLCGNYVAQHLEGYEFCISTASVLLFTDQMWASSVLPMFGLYGPDITDSAFVKFGYAVMLGMNASIAFYDTSDSIRYSWFAFVFVLFCVGCRMAVLKKAGNLALYWEYHVNFTDIVAGSVVMALAYSAKGYGDGGNHYTIGHGIWQTLSLGPGMSLWANSSSMHYSLWFWKRKRADGKYYCEVVDPTGYDVNLQIPDDHSSDTDSDSGLLLSHMEGQPLQHSSEKIDAKVELIKSALLKGDPTETLNATIEAVKEALGPKGAARIEPIQEKLSEKGLKGSKASNDLTIRRMPTISSSRIRSSGKT